MRPATEAIPKALIPVHGRPFAELQLEWLHREGVEDVVYCIGYRGEMVRSALGNGSRFGLGIHYSDEGGELRGTAGALRLALDEGALPRAFFLLNGDSYLQADLNSVEDAWTTRGLPALMTVFRNMGLWDQSNVVFADGLVRYDKHRSEGGEPPEWIDYGLSVLTSTLVKQHIPAGIATDLADVMATISKEGLVAGFPVAERFYEVGSPAGLRDLERHLAET